MKISAEICYDKTFEDYDNGILDVVNAKIAEQRTSDNYDAFFVGNMGDVVCKYKIWKSQLPRVQPFYAVKCNDDPNVLKTLAQLGTGFDCASKAEIQKVLELGVSADRIIYANPCKQASHIKAANKSKVRHMTFDNENELHKVKEIYPDAKMVLRILPPTTDKLQCNLGLKYGAKPKNAGHLLRVAKRLGLDVVGVSYHVGSGCYDADVFGAAVEVAHKVFEVAEEEGFNFTLLDIGGGFPGHEGAKITFSEITEVLRPALERYFPEERGVQLIAEPGRFFVASAFTLAVSVIASRRLHDEETGEERHMHYINDGVYGSFNCLLYDHAEQLPTLPDASKYEGQPRYLSNVWGPTCDSLDLVLKDYPLPRLAINDWLVFADMGAYTISAASTFNGMPKPACYYVCQSAFVEVLKNGVGKRTDCVLLPRRQPEPQMAQTAHVKQQGFDACPIRLRAGHAVSAVEVLEAQVQAVEI